MYALEPERKLGALLDSFCDWLGEELDAEVAVDETPDYETLAERFRKREIELAWLPPIVLLRVGEDAVPVASIRRGTRGGFETALVVREDSTLHELRDLHGKRAAWVDSWSAAGYVIPRLRLRLAGLDVSALFGEEHFYGTHTAAIRALLAGEADVAGTYAHTDAEGNVVDGPWTHLERANIRILATFGEIPADVFAVQPTVPEDLRRRLLKALVDTAIHDLRKSMVKQLFGADGFGPVDVQGYDGLRSALALASRTDDWDDMSKA
jgi:phosphate/phosphite/phosphonate ABC transporter binding protein